MSVEVIAGDLLDFPAGIDVIAHGCNAQAVMGSGLAAAIKTRYPQAFNAYFAANATGELTLGSVISADVGDGRRVVNLITQERYGRDRRHTDYEAVYVCLLGLKLSLEKALEEGRPHVLGLPHKLGSERGGADWRIISAMIHVLFHDSPVRCVIVQLPNGDTPRLKGVQYLGVAPITPLST